MKALLADLESSIADVADEQTFRFDGLKKLKQRQRGHMEERSNPNNN